MHETIAFLKDNIPEELAPRAYLIGGQVTEFLCKELGADYWTNDAMKGVRLCRQIMEGSA
jgi:methanogenic corrinoid protein MtbC1